MRAVACLVLVAVGGREVVEDDDVRRGERHADGAFVIGRDHDAAVGVILEEDVSMTL